MIWRLKQPTSRLAIAAAAGLFTGGIALTPVQAADLGGDCCADLEERVAELEATTVRKGNRKVSVMLSGQVNRAILFWDDGENQDVYFVDVENSSSRFRITGNATISPGRTAGFKIEADWFIRNNSSDLANCSAGTSGAVAGSMRCMPIANNNGGTDMRWTEFWLKDEKAGKLSLGKGEMASDGTSEVSLAGVSVVQYSNMDQIGSSFRFRRSDAPAYGSGITVGSYSNFDGASRQNRLRYDTPSLGGFTFSTSIAADDQVDAAIRFKKEWNSVRCAAAAAAYHDTESKGDEFWNYSSSASCLHTPSGLNLTLGYAERDRERDGDVKSDLLDSEFYWIQVGISRRWNSHGKTNIAFAWGSNEDIVSSGVS